MVLPRLDAPLSMNHLWEREFARAESGDPKKYPDPYRHADSAALRHPAVRAFEKKHGVKVTRVSPGSSEGQWKFDHEVPGAVKKASGLLHPAIIKAASSAVKSHRPGDIVLVSKRRSADPDESINNLRDLAGTVLYKTVSPRIQGHFGHAGILSRDGKHVIEAVDRGVQKSPFHEATRNRDFIIVRPHEHFSVGRKAARFAEAQLGKPYDSVGMVGAGAALLDPTGAFRLATRRFGIKPENAHKRKAFQCAGLVSQAYAHAGKPLNLGVGHSVASPIGLLAAKNVGLVKSHVLYKGRLAPTMGVLSRSRELRSRLDSWARPKSTETP